MPLSGHHGLARGDVGEQLERAIDVDGEVGQVAVVDPDHVRVEPLERNLELLAVVDLDQHVEVQLRASACRRSSSPGSSAATISSTASACTAAAS